MGVRTARTPVVAGAAPDTVQTKWVTCGETVQCAGGIVIDDRQRLLLIERGQEPSIGYWSVPGGRCLPGETAADACVREVAEETGLTVAVVALAGSVERAGPADVVYKIDDFVCSVVGGDLRAGDDARDVRWCSRAEIRSMLLAPGLLDALTEWDLLPA
jgi:8-oxo-dGTP diphosphatase